MKTTTIRVSMETYGRLKALKQTPYEPFDAVIQTLISADAAYINKQQTTKK